MARAGPAEPRPKVVAIQTLRAVAALTVAVVHLTFGFAIHIDHRLARLLSGDQLAQAAVALFFVISGCVMVLSSAKLFGSVRGTLTFWRRRAVRVLPPYWIATLVFVGALLALDQPYDPAFAWRSLVFIPTPTGNAEGVPFKLFLWPGWSLFYELVFYALFGASAAFGRLRAVTITGFALVGLVLAGAFVSPASSVAFAATRPIVVLFIVGMALAFALERDWCAPAWVRCAAMAAAAIVFSWVPSPKTPLGFDYVMWAGLPAILFLFAVLGGPLRLPLKHHFESLGDASYALYLLHVPFAHLWMRVFDRLLGQVGGSLGFLTLGLPLLIAISIVFHRRVERPLTDGLNRLFGDRPAKRARAGEDPRALKGRARDPNCRA